jgi:hypothetical protein
MTGSPLLPTRLVRDVGENRAGSEMTETELDRMVELALSRQACTVAIGSGRSPAAVGAGASFAGRWQATGGTVLDIVTWPERSIAFAAIGSPLAIGLVGACNLPGLAGATAGGGTWAVHDGAIHTTSRKSASR